MRNPRRAYIVPTTILVLGVLILVLISLAKALFPDQWGGPNFLGGAIAMLGFATAAVGVAAVIGTAIANRQDRHAASEAPDSGDGHPAPDPYSHHLNTRHPQ